MYYGVGNCMYMVSHFAFADQWLLSLLIFHWFLSGEVLYTIFPFQWAFWVPCISCTDHNCLRYKSLKYSYHWYAVRLPLTQRHGLPKQFDIQNCIVPWLVDLQSCSCAAWKPYLISYVENLILQVSEWHQCSAEHFNDKNTQQLKSFSCRNLNSILPSRWSAWFLHVPHFFVYADADPRVHPLSADPFVIGITHLVELLRHSSSTFVCILQQLRSRVTCFSCRGPATCHGASRCLLAAVNWPGFWSVSMVKDCSVCVDAAAINLCQESPLWASVYFIGI